MLSDYNQFTNQLRGKRLNNSLGLFYDERVGIVCPNNVLDLILEIDNQVCDLKSVKFIMRCRLRAKWAMLYWLEEGTCPLSLIECFRFDSCLYELDLKSLEVHQRAEVCKHIECNLTAEVLKLLQTNPYEGLVMAGSLKDLNDFVPYLIKQLPEYPQMATELLKECTLSESVVSILMDVLTDLNAEYILSLVVKMEKRFGLNDTFIRVINRFIKMDIDLSDLLVQFDELFKTSYLLEVCDELIFRENLKSLRTLVDKRVLNSQFFPYFKQRILKFNDLECLQRLADLRGNLVDLDDIAVLKLIPKVKKEILLNEMDYLLPLSLRLQRWDLVILLCLANKQKFHEFNNLVPILLEVDLEYVSLFVEELTFNELLIHLPAIVSKCLLLEVNLGAQELLQKCINKLGILQFKPFSNDIFTQLESKHGFCRNMLMIQLSPFLTNKKRVCAYFEEFAMNFSMQKMHLQVKGVELACSTFKSQFVKHVLANLIDVVDADPLLLNLKPDTYRHLTKFYIVLVPYMMIRVSIDPSDSRMLLPFWYLHQAMPQCEAVAAATMDATKKILSKFKNTQTNHFKIIYEILNTNFNYFKPVDLNDVFNATTNIIINGGLSCLGTCAIEFVTKCIQHFHLKPVRTKSLVSQCLLQSEHKLVGLDLMEEILKENKFDGMSTLLVLLKNDLNEDVRLRANGFEYN